VAKLVGRQGNAGAGEAAAVAIFLMGACLVAWKRESSRGLIGYGTAKLSGAMAFY
jgi:hypothetical protein